MPGNGRRLRRLSERRIRLADAEQRRLVCLEKARDGKGALRWRIQRIAQRGRRDLAGFTVPHANFWCDTVDGVRLAGTMLGTSEPRETAVVLVHGFMGYRSKKPWRILAEALAERFAVFTFDLRGHGQSAGECSGGEFEPHDVQAVVDYARARGYRRVVTIGGSLGGIAVIGQAATGRGLDGVVAISTPAHWGRSDTKAVRRATWLFVSPIGRALSRRIMGTTIRAIGWGDPEEPAALVKRIAPVPLLIVHGENDHFFSADDARKLYDVAGEPKRLLLMPNFGHAEDGFTPDFAARLIEEVGSLLKAASSR